MNFKNGYPIVLLYYFTLNIDQIKGMHKSKIVNGKDVAQIGELPYQVQLIYRIDNEHCCGGILIHTRFLLTAAHCIYDELEEDLVAIFGSIYLNGDGGVRRDIERFLPHEFYDDTTDQNDIGIVVLMREIEFNQYISPAHLPTRPIHSNSRGLVAGWGLTSEGGNPPEILQKLSMVNLDAESCVRLFKIDILKRNDAMCVHWEMNWGFGTCEGDSGGGFVSQTHPPVVHAISSAVYGKCATRPDEFTIIFNHKIWIERTMHRESNRL